jgi:hypothetical protein
VCVILKDVLHANTKPSYIKEFSNLENFGI